MNTRSVYFWLIIVSLCARTAYSQGTFTAIANNNWSNTLSWSHTGTDGDNVPDADDIVTIPNGRTITMLAGNHQCASLTIQSGGTLNMNNANALLDIFANGGVLQVDNGGTIANAVNDDGNQINFLNNASFILNGIVQTDLFEFEGTSQTVTITGGGTLLVRRFNVNANNVTVNLNTSGSFGSSGNPFTVDSPNFTITGTGTINIGSNNLNISASGVSVGCIMNVSDISAIANSCSLTVTSGGTINVGDDLRIGPNASSNDFTLTVNSGGILAISSDILFNDSGGSGDNLTFNNSGTVTVTGSINFNNETLSNITNFNSFTIDGSITGSPAANPNEFANDANATLNIAGAFDTDLTTTFTATGNTVNYDGAAQNVENTTYYNLTLSGSGAKTALGNIALRGNWTRSGTATFTPGANTVTFSALAGTSAQTIAAVGGETFSTLTINSAFATTPQIILSNPVTVTNTLNMTSGIVNLNSQLFTLGASGAASDLNRTASTTTNWMYGGSFRRFWLNATAVSSTAGNLYGLFPLGTSTASSYRPFQVNSTANPTATGSYTVTHTATTGVTDLSPVFNDGGTNIVRKHNAPFVAAISAVTGGTYNISATMTGLPAGTLSDIRLAVSNGATTVTTVGTHAAATGSAPNPTAGRTAVTLAGLTGDFRITTINITNTPLPIELISFNGEVVENTVKLNWETASELNNDFFTIERSSGGEVFTSIGQVNGAGTTSQGKTYSLIDHNPIYGISYYRLKQTDFDGTFTYSKIIPITFEGSTVPVMDVYPNPTAGDQLNIKITGLKNIESVPVVMYDQMGRECVRFLLRVDKNSGTAHKTFNPQEQLPQGMYLLKAGASPMLMKRFVVAEK